MIRIVVFLLAVIALALGATWILERPGEIVLTWQGWRVTTSITVALIALASVVVVSILLWSLFRFLVTAPGNVSEFFRERREARGWRALSRGMIAVGAGNLLLAKQSASEAQRILGQEPLALLLAAQAAQLDGNSEKAESEFRAMLGQPETRMLGLRGLYLEARRREDPAAARAVAEEAANSDTQVLWASEALLEYQNLSGEWEAALATVEREWKAGTIEKPLYRRRRAVLLAAQALGLEHSDADKAREMAREAVKLAPSLVPAAALSARLEAKAGSLRRALRLVERTWAANPHPELAETYARLRGDDTPAVRLKRIQGLARRTPDQPEAALAVARAAIEAHDYAAAREALEPFAGAPTQAMCLLMAELEATEHGDHGKAREWAARALRAKRDPVWIAGTFVSEVWLPASPLTGQIDAFAWREPPAAAGGPILEHVIERGFPRAEAASPAPPVPAPVKPTEDLLLVPEDARPRAIPKKVPAIAPVIAEPPRPDDPGLEPDVDEDLEASRSQPRRPGWLGGSA